MMLNRKKYLYIAVISVLVLISLFLIFKPNAEKTENKKNNKPVNSYPISYNQNDNTNNTDSDSKDESITDLSKIYSMNQLQNIKFAYTDRTSVFIFEDNKSILLQTSDSDCNYISMVEMSPDKDYIAYIKTQKEDSKNSTCLSSELFLYDLIRKEELKITNNIVKFSWTENSDLIVGLNYLEAGKVDKKYQEYLYDVKQSKVVKDLIKENTISFYNSNEQIIKEESGFVYKVGLSKTSIQNTDSDTIFVGWSPLGDFAVFEKVSLVGGSGFVIFNIEEKTSEFIPKSKLGAGGESSVGLNWMFDRAFISYCDSELIYVNKTFDYKMNLIDRGGGCHNEQGIVQTSPDGYKAFARSANDLRLYKQNGEFTTIPLQNSDLQINQTGPNYFKWIDNQFMLIFDASEVWNDKTEVYLFDSETLEMYKILEEAYYR